MPNPIDKADSRNYNSRLIMNTNLTISESKNWKLDWAQWSKKCQKISPQTRPSKQWHSARVFTDPQSMHVKIKKISLRDKNITKSPPIRNRHLNKLHNAANVKQSADYQGGSISLNNRFNVFNSVKYFPESASTVTNCKQNTGCLHSDDDCKHDNENITLEHAVGCDKVIKSVKPSNTKSTETAAVNVSQITKISDRNVEGELNDSSKNSFALSLQRRRPVSSNQVDKYDLDLRFRPRHQSKIASAKDCATFQKWNDQNCEKFGFIPLGNILLPPVDLNNISKEKFFDVHRRVKASGIHNFLQSQILIQSQLKPETWERHLTGYWDSQLLLLLKYGFPLDFDYNSCLESVHRNHTSGVQFADDIQAYIAEEKSFGAILGPFKESPISNLHISPFLTRDKPGAPHRRVIVDLSFPHGKSVNDGVHLDTYLGTPFILTFPTIDNITSQVKNWVKAVISIK